MSTKKRLIKDTYLVSTGIFISRIFGFIREMLIAYAFGTSAVLEAFLVAFRLPNSFRNVFAEGFSDSVATPVLSEHNKNPRKLFSLSNHLFSVTSIVLFGFSVAAIVSARYLVTLMAPGFVADNFKFNLAVSFARITFVYLFLIGLTSNMTAVLYSLKKFFVAAVNPVFLNLTFIVGVLFFRPLFQNYVLVACVVAAGIVQLIFPLISLRKSGFVFHFNPRAAFRDPDMIRMYKLFVARLWSSAVYHLNVFIDTIFASLSTIVGQGALAALYYAERIIQFPFALIAIAVSRVALVDLSSFHQEGNLDEFKKLFVFSFQNIIFFIVPLNIIFICIPDVIINIAYVRGAFGSDSAQMTSSAFFFYGVGLFFICAVKLLINTFYSLKDTVTPAKTASLSLLVNIALNTSLMFPLKIGGITLATSLASAVNFFLLFRTLHKRIGNIDWQDTGLQFRKVLLLSLIAGFSARLLWIFLPLNRYLSFLIIVLVGSFIYIAGGYMAGLKQIHYIQKWILKKK